MKFNQLILRLILTFIAIHFLNSEKMNVLKILTKMGMSLY